MNDVETSEGLDQLISLSYYSRLRFVYNLLPLLSSSHNGRVISILAGGRERTIDLTDLEVRNNYSMVKVAQSAATQTTLAFEEFATSYPSVTFCHVYPGFVNTGQLDRFL